MRMNKLNTFLLYFIGSLILVLGCSPDSASEGEPSSSSEDAANTDNTEPAPECSAQSTGDEEGERIHSFTLKACDGTGVSIDDFCGTGAVNVLLYAGWCPNCISNLENAMAARDTTFATEDYQGVAIITATASGALPNAAYCDQVAESVAGTDIVVLYDENGEIPDLIANGSQNDTQFVLDDELNIRFKGRFANNNEVDQVIASVLNE